MCQDFSLWLHFKTPVWNDVSDIGVNPLPVEDQASGRENEDADLADGGVGKLAHDEAAGREADIFK